MRRPRRSPLSKKAKAEAKGNPKQSNGRGRRRKAKPAQREPEYFQEKRNLEDLWQDAFPIGTKILSRALGGKTGRTNKGWDIGVTCIHPLNSNNLLSSLRIPSHLHVIECHRDELHRFHQVEVSCSKEPQLWNDISNFLEKASNLIFNDKGKQARYETISFKEVLEEDNALKVVVVTVAFPATALLLARDRICISASHSREDLVISKVGDLVGIKYFPVEPHKTYAEEGRKKHE